MDNYERLLPVGELERFGKELQDPLGEIVRIRSMLPPYFTPEQQGAIAWEAGDDEAARFAYGVADKIDDLKSKLAL